MGSNKMLSISIILLAMSIVFGSIWIGASLRQAGNNCMSSTSCGNEILDIEEAANYLGISHGDLLYVLRRGSLELNYVLINDKYIFTKEALHEWVSNTVLEIER